MFWPDYLTLRPHYFAHLLVERAELSTFEHLLHLQEMFSNGFSVHFTSCLCRAFGMSEVDIDTLPPDGALQSVLRSVAVQEAHDGAPALVLVVVPDLVQRSVSHQLYL
jgi:hypothetical protein